MAPEDHELCHGIPVDLGATAIEREFTRLWDRRAEEAAGEATGASRVILGNVLWLGTSRHVPHVRRILDGLVRNYPCRLFILECLQEDGANFQAFVNTHCYLPRGGSGRICCEEIHLRFGANAIEHLPGAILPLFIPDVPVHLWYFSSAPARYESMLPEVIGLADRAICEVAFQGDPAAGLRGLAEARQELYDLSWFRDEPIREQLAALFDDEEALPILDRVASLTVRWAGAPEARSALVSASLVAGWLASKLGWKVPERPGAEFAYRAESGEIAIHFEHVPGTESLERSRIVHLRIDSTQGEGVTLDLGERAGQMERCVRGPSGEWSCAPLYVQSGGLNDAGALGNAFRARSRINPFREAAARAWPLLHYSLPDGGSR